MSMTLPADCQDEGCVGLPTDIEAIDPHICPLVRTAMLCLLLWRRAGQDSKTVFDRITPVIAAERSIGTAVTAHPRATTRACRNPTPGAPRPYSCANGSNSLRRNHA